MLKPQDFLSINSEIDPSAHICPGAVIGKLFRPLLEVGGEPAAESVTRIGADVHVGHYTLIGSGSILGRGVIVDDNCSIESDVVIGERSLIIYRAHICNEAQIGKYCVIGGLVAERVVVGDRTRIFGKIVHSQHDPTVGWDAPTAVEPSATLESDVFVGFNALIVGEVTLGAMAYVCAGAIVTRDVPAKHIAHGVNKIVPFDKWKGKLANSPCFGERPRK
jgi:UDP-3-O-[3-hydroxymyristoyl] glucosamine N-acyltransferase